MVKSSRDYIKRKLEQSRTHCQYIFEHLMFIRDKYLDGDYKPYEDTVTIMIDHISDLDRMLKEFREVC